MGGGATLSLVGQSQESVVCQVPLGGWPKAQRAQGGEIDYPSTTFASSDFLGVILGVSSEQSSNSPVSYFSNISNSGRMK